MQDFILAGIYLIPKGRIFEKQKNRQVAPNAEQTGG